MKSSKKPQKRFQFIDNSNVTSIGSSSTQVRRHVMQEYMREKRWESRAQHEGDSEPDASDHLQQAAVKARARTRGGRQRASKLKSEKVMASSIRRVADNTKLSNAKSFYPQYQSDDMEGISEYVTEAFGSSGKSHTPFILGPADFAELANIFIDSSSSSATLSTSEDSLSPPFSTWSSTDTGSLSPEPQTLLSAARTDPFNSLPMKLNTRDQELFDFYANVMPSCSYGFERRSPHAHNWYLSVFIPEALKGAVCFQNTILVHAANTQAWVRGLAETPLAIEHRARASAMLLKHFQKYPYDTSDAAISATLSAAALEDFDPRLERREYAWSHFRAAVQKIRDRGGPVALVQHNRLQMLVSWSDYIFSGYNAHGPTFYFDHESSPSYSTPSEAQAIARREISQQCTEFITFLKCIEHLSLVQANLQNNAVSRSQQPIRYTAFQGGEPLYNLLASPNGPRYTKTGQLKQILSRLAALLTINTAIWEYRHSQDLGEEFFAELLSNIRYNELDRNISVEALVQILLSGSKNPNLLHSERPWFVGRMLKVAKRLRRPAFEKLNDILLDYLTLGPNLMPTMSGWEDELRQEILRAPLVSYVLPLMQEPLS